MPPKFLLKFHAAVIKEIPIDKTSLTIGRKPDNDVIIDNMAVSSHHARIIMQGRTYMIEDLQSTNGTKVNGESAQIWKRKQGLHTLADSGEIK